MLSGESRRAGKLRSLRNGPLGKVGQWLKCDKTRRECIELRRLNIL